MSWFAAYLHVVFTMFLIGYVLYWTVMLISLRRDFTPGETERLLEIASRGAWPHVLVPWRFRPPLRFMGLGFLAILVISGLPLMARYGLGAIVAVKMALVMIFAVAQVGLMRRPARALIIVNFVLALGIVILSGLMIRV
jgi:hypothetical protein